jgi:cell division protease FtsH
LNASFDAALDADARDLASLGSFAIGAMIQRGAAAKDMVERIKGKLAPHAKARIELETEQEAEQEAEGGAEASGTAGSGGTPKITKLENGKTVPVNPGGDKAIGGKSAGVKSGAYDNDANDPNVPRLEELAGYGPAAVWGLELAQDIADYRNGTIGWSELDRGLVLAGPPGVGKTIFARSLAKTAGISFLASSFTKWESHKGGHHGDVIKTMAEHFDEARKCAPCIMLIDEIDSIPNRERLDDHSRAWWTSMVNGLLEQLDGSLARDGVIVIGACNDASQLDPALVRSGRLEKIIHIPYPSTTDLAKIFRFHLRQDLPGFDPMTIAEGLNGFTGADVEATVRSARRKARREQREVTVSALDDALFGEETISDTQLWRTAIHEAGHAIAATALSLEPVDFISVRMRGQTGGFVRLGGSDTKQGPNPFTRSIVLARVAQTLAGRAAETIIFGAPDTGSGGSKSSDLAKATKLLGQTHSQHGLGRDGNLVWHPPLPPAKPWPANIAASIALDLSEQQSRAEAIITANTALVTELAETLMATKTMIGDVFASTFAGRVRKDPDKDQVAAT